MREQLPVNIEAEQAVIGSLLLDRDAVITVASWLSVDHFYLPMHRNVYAAILDCYRRSVPPDLITVLDVLTSRGQAIETGGYPGLAQLSSVVSTAYHVEHYGRIVERYAFARSGIQAGGKIAALCYDTERTQDDITGEIMKIVTGLDARGGEVSTSMTGAFDELCREWETGISAGMSTGFLTLDELLGGLFDGDLLILAARPGMGKSSLAWAIALKIAFSATPGAVHGFSLEMGKKQVMQRMIANRLGYDLKRIIQQRWTEGELPRLLNCAGVITESEITIDETANLTIGALRARMLRHIATHGKPKLVVVDYLQLLDGDGNYKNNRVAEMTDVSRGLKHLAREASVPVLALAQLNRAIEHRTNQVPQLSDLRESGSIEADADIVMFISRDTESTVTADGYSTMNISVAKHRNGPQGIVPLQFNGSTQRWRETTYQSVPGY